MEEPLLPGEVRISGRMVVGFGDATVGAVEMVGRLAVADTAVDEGAVGI